MSCPLSVPPFLSLSYTFLTLLLLLYHFSFSGYKPLFFYFPLFVPSERFPPRPHRFLQLSFLIPRRVYTGFRLKWLSGTSPARRHTSTLLSPSVSSSSTQTFMPLCIPAIMPPHARLVWLQKIRHALNTKNSFELQSRHKIQWGRLKETETTCEVLLQSSKAVIPVTVWLFNI